MGETIPCSCTEHDRPEVALGRAMALAREIARMIRGECASLLDARARGVATTVACAAEERAIWQDRYAGPITGLGEVLDRLVAASVGPVETTVVVDHDEHGPVSRRELRDLPDARLVALRDRVCSLSAALEAVRDIVAADEAVARMRRDAMA
jgi:hypothetical protein